MQIIWKWRQINANLKANLKASKRASTRASFSANIQASKRASTRASFSANIREAADSGEVFRARFRASFISESKANSPRRRNLKQIPRTGGVRTDQQRVLVCPKSTHLGLPFALILRACVRACARGETISRLELSAKGFPQPPTYIHTYRHTHTPSVWARHPATGVPLSGPH